MIEQEPPQPPIAPPDLREIIDMMKSRMGGMMPREIAIAVLVGWHAAMKFTLDSRNAEFLEDQLTDCENLMKRAQKAKGHDMTKVIQTVSRLDGIAANRN